jgi:hypothetical protein
LTVLRALKKTKRTGVEHLMSLSVALGVFVQGAQHSVNKKRKKEKKKKRKKKHESEKEKKK